MFSAAVISTSSVNEDAIVGRSHNAALLFTVLAIHYSHNYSQSIPSGAYRTLSEHSLFDPSATESEFSCMCAMISRASDVCREASRRRGPKRTNRNGIGMSAVEMNAKTVTAMHEQEIGQLYSRISNK